MKMAHREQEVGLSNGVRYPQAQRALYQIWSDPTKPTDPQGALVR
jgi:hypothetical protein